MDGNLAYHLSNYPWIPQLLCPSINHPWMETLPTTCQTIHGCHSYCAIHGPSIFGHLGCPSPSLCLSIHGWHSYCPSMDGHLAYHLSKYPWMPPLLCHPWTIHRWRPWLPFPQSLSKYPWMAQLLCPSMDATVTVPSINHP